MSFRLLYVGWHVCWVRFLWLLVRSCGLCVVIFLVHALCHKNCAPNSPVIAFCCGQFYCRCLSVFLHRKQRNLILMSHNSDVIMNAVPSQITSLTVVYSSAYSGADERKHRGSVSLAFVRGIHRWPVNSPHKGPVTRKIFPFDDIIMQKKHGSHGATKACLYKYIHTTYNRAWMKWPAKNLILFILNVLGRLHIFRIADYYKNGDKAVDIYIYIYIYI